jgi:hypothetical protein
MRRAFWSNADDIIRSTRTARQLSEDAQLAAIARDVAQRRAFEMDDARSTWGSS